MEASGMARRSKQDYLRIMWQRYQHAGRAERSALLDEVTRMCGYHRKYAIGVLNRQRPPQTRPRRLPTRRPTYSAEVISVLAWICPLTSTSSFLAMNTDALSVIRLSARTVSVPVVSRIQMQGCR